MRFLSLAVAACVVLLSSCNKTDNKTTTVEEGKAASMKITIAGEAVAKTRAVNAEAVIPEESKIFDFSVIVFNASTNKVQAVQSFTDGGLTQTVTGLTTGPKKIVVIANTVGAGITLPAVGDDYSFFASSANKIDLNSQTYDEMIDHGFVMSGEAEITLTAGSNTLPGALSISRVVARIRLGNLTVAPEPGHDGVFILQNVLIMKAKSFSNFGPGGVTTYAPYTGGYIGDVTSTQNSALIDPITDTDKAGRLYYVFANDASDSNATLLVVEGTYNGETRYFAVRVNDGTGLAGSTTNGGFIKRNGSYKINMTIKRPGDGSTDPEVPVDPATLDLTVTPEPWETELVQDIEI